MKRFLPFLAITMLIVSIASAQSITVAKIIIKGMVVDSVKSQPLSFVTVVLKDAKSNQAIKTVLTKDNGSFEISAAANKQYQLAFAFIGYKTKTVNVSVTDEKPVWDIKIIPLSISGGQLKEVSVTETKPLMKQEVDRISYDVQADPESKATTALDMMRKVPLLSVDANDNIKLKGSGSYKILINGKESALMAKNPSDVLKAMPASNIEKVEVITTPPAKYDAEGLAGIINIITKHNADQGYNGSVNTRFNTLYGPGINLNGTVKQGKFGLSGYLGYGSNGDQTNVSGKIQTFTINQAMLQQGGTDTYSGNNKYGDAELSYEIDSLNLLTSSIEFYNGRDNRSQDQFSSLVNNLGATTQQYRLNNSGYNTYLGFDASMNYQLGFKKKKEQLLTLSYKYDYSPNKQFNDNVFSDILGLYQPNYQQFNNAGNKSHTMQLDYVQPFKKINIEAGGKAIFRNNFSDFETSNFNSATNQYIVNPAQSNNFNYHQNVYSFYNSYQVKLDKWAAKVGLRMEHTSINANFISAGNMLDRSYDNLIPSVSLQRSLKSSSFNFGFTERIQRPGIWQLNPFVDKSNPKFVSTGNPDLRPELNHSFELTYSSFAKGSINIGVNYAFSNNAIQNITNTSIETSAGGKKDTITTTTYQNLGSNDRLGLNLNTNLTFFKKLSFSMNAQIQHVWLKGTYNGQFYQNDGLRGSAFLNTAYKFDKGYRIGLNAGYFSGDVTLQGATRYYIYTSYVFSKEMLNKKASISLVANNPYSKFYTFTSTTSTADFDQSTYNQNRYSTFALRLSYKFGKLNSDIKKNKRGISNDDSKASGGGGNSSGK